MGRTIVVVIIILLSLACGALGWEVMRQQSDKQDLQREVQALQTRLTALEAPKFEPPQRKWATEEMINDLSTHLQSLDKKTQDLLASQQELDKKLAALKESGVVAKSGQGSPVDIPNMTEEQKEALREMVKKESDARDMQRANMIKSMVKQRFNQELQKVSEQLDLSPLQKDDVNKLVDKQINKGFEALVAAFEKGDFESVREQLRTLVEETDVEIKKILDPDQLEKLKELDPQGFGRREERRRQSE